MIPVKEVPGRVTRPLHDSLVPPDFKIVERRLNKDEARIIVNEVKNTPNITGYTVREWLRCKHTLVAENNHGMILGACMNDDFAKNWTEIAVLIVLQKYRRQGICKALLEIAFKKNWERKKNMLIMSREPNVLRMMKQINFDIFYSLKDLTGPYKKDKFILTYYYKLRSMMSMYRHMEVFRKKIVFNVNTPFVYGLKYRQI